MCDNLEPEAHSWERVCAQREGVEPVCTQTNEHGGYRLALPTGDWQVCFQGDCSSAVYVGQDRAVRVDLDGWQWVLDGEVDTGVPQVRGPLVFVIIIDDSVEENMTGTPGADICDVRATCAEGPVAALTATLAAGDGDLASEGLWTDPAAAIDASTSCDRGDLGVTAVSLGMAGWLVVEFASELIGCTVTVGEVLGNQDEGFEVYVCDRPDAQGECASGGPIAWSNGGTVSAEVP